MITQTASKLVGVEVARSLPAVSAVLLGFALILAVGFVQMDTVHNAAHDTRHAAAFPCH